MKEEQDKQAQIGSTDRPTALSQKIVHLKTEFYKSHHIFFDAGSFSFVQKLLSEIH